MRPASLSSRLVLAALLVTLGACSSSTGGTPDAGTVVELLPCSTDAECTSLGFVCDTVRRACVCTKDAMCADKQGAPYCNTFSGRCEATVKGCKGDSECAEGQFCDAALRTCRAKKGYCETCTQDEECGGAGDFCVHHPDFASAPAFCGLACADDAGCPAGQNCRDTEKGKQCVPAQGKCGGANACVPDSWQQCARDGDCTQLASQICDTTAGHCIAAQSTCPAGSSCDPVTLRCAQSCRRDQDCVERFGDPNYACRNNTCVRAEQCRSDTECPRGKWCFKEPGRGDADPGVCAASCTSDAECPVNTVCATDVATGRNRCQAGCNDNEDCPLNAICVARQCEATTATGTRRCQVKEVCDFREACTNNACIPQPDHCRPCGAGCGGSGTCADMYTDIQAATCNLLGCNCGSMTCPGGGRPIVDQLAGLCACPIQRCALGCTSDANCPKGFGCSPFNGRQYCFPLGDAKPCR